MRWTALTLGLAGCAAAAPQTTAPPPAAVTPVAGGLSVEGTGREISFGRAEAGAVATVSRLTGTEAVGPAFCPGGGRVWRWPDGLEMTFVGTQFVGWRTGDGAQAGSPCASRGV